LAHFRIWKLFLPNYSLFMSWILKKMYVYFFTYSASSIHLRSSSSHQPVQNKWQLSCQRQRNSICYYQPYHDLFIRSLKLDNILSDSWRRYCINSISFYASNDILLKQNNKPLLSRTCNSNKYSDSFFHVLICRFLNLRKRILRLPWIHFLKNVLLKKPKTFLKQDSFLSNDILTQHPSLN